MSLDDQYPTEYFGAHAVRWTHPDGRVLSLDPATHRRAEAWAQTLHTPDPAARKDDLTGYTPAPHRPDCPQPRIGRCLCAYLAQWDDRAGQPVFPARPDRLFDDGSAADDLFKHPGTLVPAKEHPAALSLRFWKGQARHWQKGYWLMAGLAVTGWGVAAARGIWGF